MSQRELFPGGADDQHVLTVAELTAEIKDLLEAAFSSVWVAGEVSDFARPRSGHCYLTLKDDRAQIRAVLWRTTASRIRFDLHDGLEVVCRGHVDVYAPRGSYQLIVQQIEPKGIGALELALRQLREKLAREGLFDPQHKRPLPRFMRRIGLVTSPTGAAIRDFLEVLRGRYAGADVLIVPVRVQGDGAAEEIADAVALLNGLAQPPDCIVLTRGGGSLEDLWAFNEEAVVRAVFASRVPVVSAVGHEIDVTLSDLVADVRALTPSEAATLVAPATAEIVAGLHHVRKRMATALGACVARARARLDALAAHRAIRRPLERVHDLARRLDELEARSRRAIRQHLSTARQHTESIAGRLDTLSPLAVLGRGYSVTRRADDGRVVRDATQLAPGQRITTRFARGETVSRVETIDERS